MVGNGINDDDDNDDNDDSENTSTSPDKKEEQICIICLNVIDPPVVLYENTEYTKNCKCNTPIHKICLKEWYDKTQSCPICRKKIWYGNITYNNNTHFFVSICTQSVVYVMRVLFVMQLLFIFYSVYFIFNI